MEIKLREAGVTEVNSSALNDIRYEETIMCKADKLLRNRQSLQKAPMFGDVAVPRISHRPDELPAIADGLKHTGARK